MSRQTFVARGSGRARPLVLLLVLLSITLIAIDKAGDDAPTHFVRSDVRDAFGSFASTVGRLWPFDDGARVSRLEQDNATLRGQLDEARGELSAQADTKRERDELAALSGLPTADGVPKVIARVTAIETSNFDATIELGKGSDAGIVAGMPVADGKGLVGRVVQTSRQRSVVLLVTDSTSNIGVRFPAGDIGVSVGQGQGQSLRVDLIDTSSTVKDGDVAVTSGMQHSLFPPGIPVGTVRSSAAGPQDLRRDVRLDPVLDLKRLDEVAVLKWSPP